LPACTNYSVSIITILFFKTRLSALNLKDSYETQNDWSYVWL
jgi:hypothetical protein